jgi:hypothetical protein
MVTSDDWLEPAPNHCILCLRIQPGARRTAVLGVWGGQLKVAVQAPPVDGQANEALLRWLAKTLELKRREVTLISGQTSRDKRVRVEPTQADHVRTTLCRRPWEGQSSR